VASIPSRHEYCSFAFKQFHYLKKGEIIALIAGVAKSGSTNFFRLHKPGHRIRRTFYDPAAEAVAPATVGI